MRWADCPTIFLLPDNISYIPDKEQLIAQVEAVLKEWHGKHD